MPRSERPDASVERSMPYVGWLILAAFALTLVAILLPRPGKAPSGPLAVTNSITTSSEQNRESHPHRQRVYAAATSGAPDSAQEIVAAKLSQFVHGRRDILAAMADKFGVKISADVDRFFAAAEAGRWDEVTNLFAVLDARRKSPEATDIQSLQTLWAPILETFGVAEAVHQWPADKLLNYGQAVLDSLRPGMVYAGGTDAGRFIPTLLNETSDGERHIVLTQNALADGSYVSYLNFLYADRMAPITPEDSEKAFADYIKDAQHRLATNQLRPGEDVRVTDGRVQVSGQVAVMAINERLLQLITDKNPGMAVAMEESFPFKSMYSDAVPCGPILELHGPDSNTSFQELAVQAVDYWRNQAQQFTSEQGFTDDAEARKAWAKMASSQAGLLTHRGAGDQAAAIFDAGLDMCPSSPEVIFRYVNLLLIQNKPDAALAVAERGLAAAPENTQFKDLARRLRESAEPKR